jgi:putative membrane protein
MHYRRRGGFVWFSNSPPNEDENWFVSLLIRWAINSLALWIAAEIIPGISYDEWTSIVIAAALFGLVNAIVKPLVFLVTLPITCLTLGLFILVLNALMLALTAWISDVFDINFTVDGFWSAVFGAIVISLVSFALSQIRISFFSDRKGDPR